ncbi:MAG TPA: chemotaxis protein CheW [Nitrospiraceae bacterium]|nr:chemotaxis protein CheW [Nitrospiraceae bacterium]
MRMCVVSLGGELFAIDLRNIREVFEVEAVTPVPGMPGMLTGVTNLRGTVIPLLDLRASLGLSVGDVSLPFAVVIRHGPRHVGVLVDHVPEIRSIPRDHLLPAAHSGPAGARPFVSSVLRLEDRLGGVLEVPLVFAQVDGGEAVLQTQ